ncbi:MAG: glycoside hydrolase family 13 [Planctomycetota bacterium]|nr:MAG: glycoside hydrolase family 13 [Planctomycetota bacterium]
MKPQTQESLGVKPVEIKCEAPDAEIVMLVGDFNDWNPDATPMKKDASGRWIARLELVPGQYEYKFVIDGCWCCEPGEPDAWCSRPDRVRNSHGTMNRVISVK